MAYNQPVSEQGTRQSAIMMNMKLQAALDELERLHDTVREYKSRNGKLPGPDSDAGRAVTMLQTFHDSLKKLDIGKLLDR